MAATMFGKREIYTERDIRSYLYTWDTLNVHFVGTRRYERGIVETTRNSPMLILNSAQQSVKKDEILAYKRKIAYRYTVTSQRVEEKETRPGNGNPWYNRCF